MNNTELKNYLQSIGVTYNSKKEINWKKISTLPLSEDFIRRNSKKLSWREISTFQKLSESFIEEHSNLIYWDLISIDQNLSEEFIEKHKNLMSATDICTFQILSEDFIERNKNWVDWYKIGSHQILSWEFIKKYKDYLIESKSSFLRVQPFIEDVSLVVKDSSIGKVLLSDILYNEMNKEYLRTKERGWFIGYLQDRNYHSNFNLKGVSLDPSYGIRFSIFLTGRQKIKLNLTKARVYWKDLVKVGEVKNYEFIRRFKFVGQENK